MFNEFKFAIPITRAYKNSDGEMFFEGFASSTSIDSFSTIFNRKCQDGFAFDIMRGMESREPVELEAEHLGDEEPINILGALINAQVTEDSMLKVTTRLDPDNPKAVYYYKKMTVPDAITGKTKQFGLSINGVVKDAHFEYNEDLQKNVRVFDRVELKRVGIVRKPSNPDSWIEKIVRSVEWSDLDDDEIGETLLERAYEGIDFSPSQEVINQFKKGLKLYEDGRGGKGLVQSTITWARKIAAGKDITPEKARKMSAWHARHEVDKKPGWDKSGEETPGYVAFLLWGGSSGRKWADRLVKAMEKMDNKETRQEEVLESTEVIAEEAVREEMSMEQLMQEVPGKNHHMDKLLELLTTIVETIDTLEDMTELSEEQDPMRTAADLAMRKLGSWMEKRYADASNGAVSMKEDLSEQKTMLTPMAEKRAEEELPKDEEEDQVLADEDKSVAEELKDEQKEEGEMQERGLQIEHLSKALSDVIDEKFNSLQETLELITTENKALRSELLEMKQSNEEMIQRLQKVEGEPSTKPAAQLIENVLRGDGAESRREENIQRARELNDTQELIKHKLFGSKYVGYGEFN